MIIDNEDLTYRFDSNKFILTLFVNNEDYFQLYKNDNLIELRSGIIKGFLNSYIDKTIVYVQNDHVRSDCFEGEISEIDENKYSSNLTFKIKRIK